MIQGCLIGTDFITVRTIGRFGRMLFHVRLQDVFVTEIFLANVTLELFFDHIVRMDLSDVLVQAVVRCKGFGAKFTDGRNAAGKVFLMDALSVY